MTARRADETKTGSTNRKTTTAAATRRFGVTTMRRPNQRLMALQVENWNLKHPVGTEVTLRKDSGEVVETKTRYAAYVADSGHAVCFLKACRATTCSTGRRR